MAEYKRPKDIEDLKKMLDGGGDADAMNDRAIEIFDRLKKEKKQATHKADISTKERINHEQKDFEDVMEKIVLRKNPIFYDRARKYIDESS